VLKNEKSEIKKHAKTKKHRDFCNQLGFNQIETEDNFHALNVRKGELSTALISEYNMAVEHLPSIIKKMYPDSEINKDVKVNRKKCAKLMKNVITKEITETLIKNNAIFNFRRQKYTVSILE